MKCLYHGLLSPPIFAFEFNFMSHLKRFYNEKENPFFEPATKLCYAVGALLGLVGGIKTYSKFSSGDPDTSKTAASWFFACIFLIVAATILRSFFL